MSRFEPYGPFEIPRNKGRIEGKGWKDDFWNKVNENVPGLSDACGCYIFIAGTPKQKLKPWYVGQAKKSFAQEVFTPGKLVSYNDVIHSTSRVPLMFLLAKLTPRGGFATKRKTSKATAKDNEIDYVETLLIRLALEKNSKLINIQKAAMLLKLELPGVLGKSRTKPGKALQELLSF